METEIVDIDEQEEYQKKINNATIGEKRRIINKNYYLRNSVRLKERVKNRRRKSLPKPLNRNGTLFYDTNYLARELGLTAAFIRKLEYDGVLMKTPFHGTAGDGRAKLYPQPMFDIIVRCFNVARAVCGSSKYLQHFKRLLKGKWLQAEIRELW